MKVKAKLALLLCVCLCALPVPTAVAAPWLPQLPTPQDLTLSNWFATGQAQRQQTAADEAVDEQPAADAPQAGLQMQTYTVRSGDSLWAIAGRYGTTPAQLRTWNGLRGDLIRVGQLLKVGESQVVTHTVESGDTLWSIAAKYRTTVASLASANGLSSRGTIHPGERLAIPAVGQQVSRGSTSYRLIWPVTGIVTSGWGYRTRFEKFHYGLDIAADTGTPIKAVMAGVVEFAGWKSGYGYCVFIDHGNGLKTGYGHASKLYVKAGQRVSQNQTIAAVGSTGFSTGPHVHFEVRVNGVLSNPVNYLP